MTKLLESIGKWLTPNQQSDLETYIISKNPSNAAEVEFWTREYENRAQRHFS